MIQRAITRKPCSNFAQGITTAQLGQPDFLRALRQYSDYVNALKSCGLEVTQLEADESFPDSCFVEDVAVVTDEVAVITNPGAVSRKGEIQGIIPVLEKIRELSYIQSPGTLEGGDVMQIEKHFYVGLTHRTNEVGAHQLGSILSPFGYSYSAIPVGSALHLKTAVNYIVNNILLASKEFILHPAFKHFHVIEVEDDELYAANCLLINDTLIIPGGFGKIKSALMELNYHMIELDMSEFEKMDGGLTCLSLRFS